jgi:hypothetical protein
VTASESPISTLRAESTAIAGHGRCDVLGTGHFGYHGDARIYHDGRRIRQVVANVRVAAA